MTEPRPGEATAAADSPRAGLVVGIGCRRGVSAAAIADAVATTIAALPAQSGRWSLADIAAVATVCFKADEAGLRAFCASLRVPMRTVAAARLAAPDPADRPPSDASAAPSDAVARLALRGVCEPCALFVAGPGARLLAGKSRHGAITVALALPASN